VILVAALAAPFHVVEKDVIATCVFPGAAVAPATDKSRDRVRGRFIFKLSGFFLLFLNVAPRSAETRMDRTPSCHIPKSLRSAGPGEGAPRSGGSSRSWL